MKTALKLILVIMLFTASTMIAQPNSNPQQNRVELSDLENLVGNWKGTLTYMDYSSKKEYSMPSELAIKMKKKNRTFILQYTYPNEPKANSKGKFKVSKDRSKLNGKLVVARTKTPDGNSQIITEYKGKDGNDKKSATIRNTYIIGAEKFVIRKEVQFEGTNDWVLRNEYNFEKI